MDKSFLRTGLLLVAAGTFSACSSPTSSTTLDITYTPSPDPAVAAVSHGVTYTITNADDTTSKVEYAWVTSFTVEIKEEAGLALDITSVNLGVQQAAGGIVITPSGGDTVHYKFTSTASGNHLPAKGTSSMGFTVWYSNPNDQKEALVTVSLGYQDSDDNTYTNSFSVKVAP
jgi:hypothetical protein